MPEQLNFPEMKVFDAETVQSKFIKFLRKFFSTNVLQRGCSGKGISMIPISWVQDFGLVRNDCATLSRSNGSTVRSGTTTTGIPTIRSIILQVRTELAFSISWWYVFRDFDSSSWSHEVLTTFQPIHCQLIVNWQEKMTIVEGSIIFLLSKDDQWLHQHDLWCFKIIKKMLMLMLV